MDKREEIVELVEKNLPRFSGERKVFVIGLKIGAETVKIVFWRPRNYTLVAHNYKVPIEKGVEIFEITAYHDSCWRYDGFSFLNKFPVREVKDLQVASLKVLDEQTCFTDDTEKYFIIKNSHG